MAKRKQQKKLPLWSWLKVKFNQFQDWCATWWPGLKTEVTAALGFIGSFAAVMQEFVSGIPLSQLVTPRTALILPLVLFALAFWFRRLGKRDV